MTVGIDFYTYDVPIIAKGKEALVRLSLWDFGGQEQFKSLFPYYINGANGIFLVFDLLSMESLIKLDWWYAKLIHQKYHSQPKIVIGTKLDLAELEDKQLRVDELIIEQFLQNHNDKTFLKTSSKDNTNIIESFKEMVRQIMRSHKLEFDKIL